MIRVFISFDSFIVLYLRFWHLFLNYNDFAETSSSISWVFYSWASDRLVIGIQKKIQWQNRMFFSNNWNGLSIFVRLFSKLNDFFPCRPWYKSTLHLWRNQTPFIIEVATEHYTPQKITFSIWIIALKTQFVLQPNYMRRRNFPMSVATPPGDPSIMVKM